MGVNPPYFNKNLKMSKDNNFLYKLTHICN